MDFDKVVVEGVNGIYTYDIHNSIGHGSYSVVYRGKADFFLNDTCEDNLVAVKKISLTKLNNNVQQKLRKELELVQNLDHKNIVKSFDVIIKPAVWYIVMEYCNLGMLTDVNKYLRSITSDRLREQNAHYYLTQLKDALSYLRDNKIIHRDLKPMNIMITGIRKSDELDYNHEHEYVLKLTDFGFARDYEEEDESDQLFKTICGSPAYMSPEILSGKDYNTQTELWSFGIIMYECLYGFGPYRRPENITILRKRMNNDEILFYEERKDFTKHAFKLLKDILIADPEFRLSWYDFLEHEWFQQKFNEPDENMNEIINDFTDYVIINKPTYSIPIKKKPMKRSGSYMDYIFSKSPINFPFKNSF